MIEMNSSRGASGRQPPSQQAVDLLEQSMEQKARMIQVKARMRVMLQEMRVTLLAEEMAVNMLGSGQNPALTGEARIAPSAEIGTRLDQYL
jgi:hypothetical protein